MQKKYKILLIGATGLVGGCLLKQLLKRSDVSKITVLIRDPKGISRFQSHPLLSVAVFDFQDWDSVREQFQCDVLLIALGTTIKKAGSQQEFARIDRDLVLQCARFAREQGAHTVGVVSALGANSRSRIFYNRIKGQMEIGILQLQFPWTVFIQPSLILGQRQEHRSLELWSQKMLTPFLGLMQGPLRTVAPVSADSIAANLIRVCMDESSTKAGSKAEPNTEPNTEPKWVRIKNKEIT